MRGRFNSFGKDRQTQIGDREFECLGIASAPSIIVHPSDIDSVVELAIKDKHLMPLCKTGLANGYMLSLWRKEVSDGFAVAVTYGIFEPI